MELVYLLNGSSSGGGGGDGGSSSGYPLVKAVVQDGAVGLQDRSVTRVELKTSDAVRINFPPKTAGVARDFLLRLVITADAVPEVTFAVPTGETFSFEEGSDESFQCLVGVNIFAFTETDDGCFVVNRKLVSIAQSVAFDANGGTVDTPAKDYQLGVKYGTLPTPVWTGHVFQGWFTETESGVEVSAMDTAKTSVTRLYAHWEGYVDKYGPAIAVTEGLVFVSDGDAPWTLDDDDGYPEAPCARSGAIGDNQSSSLFTTVEGSGKISYMMKISSEQNYDKLFVLVDGVQMQVFSGARAWVDCTITVSKPGTHTVEWRYKKDGSVSRGSDCCWIDNVGWEAS